VAAAAVSSAALALAALINIVLRFGTRVIVTKVSLHTRFNQTNRLLLIIPTPFFRLL
jgi:hypothetical protein